MATSDSLLDIDAGHPDASYLREVATFFLALRGTGLFLSPLDAEEIEQWLEAQYPLPAVLRGLHRGAEKLHAKKQPLRNLRRLKRYVAREVKDATSGRFRACQNPDPSVDPFP